MNTGLWYKKSSTGKMVQWQGWSDGDTFFVQSGQVGGKLTTTAGTQCIGKQKRTDSEQASFQLNAKLNKKKDDGYLDDMEAAKTHVVMLPMLAHPYTKRKHNISFPCIVQRKFDGVRCFAVGRAGSRMLLSRKGKAFPHLDHILRDMRNVPTDITLDGELYSDEMTFQELVGLVKRVTHTPAGIKRMGLIKLRVYDMYSDKRPDLDFERRASVLRRLDMAGDSIVNTANYTAYSEYEIYSWQRQFIEEGYEGAMVRNLKGAYALGKRSANLQKVKTFMDGEYKIVAYTQGEGNEAGCVVWQCITDDGQTFNVRPKGTREDRLELFITGSQYIGKMLTVKYQELTDGGIPRFPVGIAMRDYE